MIKYLGDIDSCIEKDLTSLFWQRAGKDMIKESYGTETNFAVFGVNLSLFSDDIFYGLILFQIFELCVIMSNDIVDLLE